MMKPISILMLAILKSLFILSEECIKCAFK